jgi:hypothetical protein
MTKKLNKEKSFKEFVNDEADKSIEESYANYGGTNALGTVSSGSASKYTPATVLKADPLRYKNPDVTMGQNDFETQAPDNMMYPFESIFVELVEIYMRTESSFRMMEQAKDMATLSDAKQQLVTEAANELERIQNRLRVVISNVEQITV